MDSARQQKKQQQKKHGQQLCGKGPSLPPWMDPAKLGLQNRAPENPSYTKGFTFKWGFCFLGKRSR